MNRTALALAALVLVALPLAGAWALTQAAPAPAAPRPTAFAAGAGNLTQARQHLVGEGYPVASLVGSLELAGGGALLIIPEPARAPTAAEAAALDRHLAAGGSVWVAGGVALDAWVARHGIGLGTQPLLQLDAPAPGAVLLDGSLDGAAFTRVAAFLPSALVVQPGQPWQPLLRSPATSYLDADADGAIGRGDPPGPFLVGALLALPSGGTLVATADASLLTDRAWALPRSENAAFLHALLVRLHPASVLLDESQHGWPAAEGPWVAAVAATGAVARLPWWASGLLFLVLASLAGLTLRRLAPLVPFRPHKAADPAHPPLPEGDGTVLEAAWELLARRTGRPPSELREAGPEAARGLAEDPRLRRVLLGQGGADDRRHVLSAYIQETS